MKLFIIAVTLFAHMRLVSMENVPDVEYEQAIDEEEAVVRQRIDLEYLERCYARCQARAMELLERHLFEPYERFPCVSAACVALTLMGWTALMGYAFVSFVKALAQG